jgi:two-component system, OmpR family, phosphate regulon sensor histidine kinase PhoR
MNLSSAPDPLNLIKQNKQMRLSSQDVTVAEINTGEPLNRVLKVYASPLRDSAEQMMGHVLVVHDITRERELDQMKSDFISTVSHELRTPLFSIRGFAKLMLDGKVKDETTRNEFLEIITQQSEQLMNIVNDLLDLSRLDVGRSIDLRIEAVDGAKVVEDALARLAALAAEKHITLDKDLQPSLPLVRADMRRLYQVLINLIGNAIKFTPEGGHVSVRVQVLESPRAMQVTVSDTGIGIPADAIPRLFERFYQVDHSETRKSGGTGLGLYITKQIIEALDGTICIESVLGRGSQFSFRLPLIS